MLKHYGGHSTLPSKAEVEQVRDCLPATKTQIISATGLDDRKVYQSLRLLRYRGEAHPEERTLCTVWYGGGCP